MQFYAPTRLYCGDGIVLQQASLLSTLGRHALIVTSPHAGAASGALDDITDALRTVGTTYTLFDQVQQNPSLSSCFEAGALARAAGCDCVIGVGGGSPLDAAKAIAAFAANPSISPMELFSLPQTASVLPIAAIPTTAGTGSEMNDHAVLTVDGERKQNFKILPNYPRFAFLDPRYTASLPQRYAISTALDTLCHCIESYLTPTANPLTEALCLGPLPDIWRGLQMLAEEKADADTRLKLLQAAAMGGIAIAMTGTSVPHPMGYSLSLFYGLPHGAACALFLPAFLRRVQTVFPERVETVMARLGTNLEKLTSFVTQWHGFSQSLSEMEVSKYIGLVRGSKSLYNGLAPMQEEDMRRWLSALPGLPDA